MPHTATDSFFEEYLVESTALGAAGLAGLAVGTWRTPQDFLAGQARTAFVSV